MDEKENLEPFFLLWLDASVNTSDENIKAQKTLRESINFLRTFEDPDVCEQYIRSVSPYDQIIFIVSGRLGKIVVPHIHCLRQVSAIYVYCHDKKLNEKWSEPFKKVRGVIVLLDEVISTIRSDRARRSRRNADNPLSMNFNGSTMNQRQQSTSDLDGQYVHTQLLLDCLVRMKSSSDEKKDLIELCRKFYADNKVELCLVEQFEKNYQSDRALWWYTRESFVYRLLNKALRTLNIDLLYLFRFLIRDIDQELRKLSFPCRLCLYRGQWMSMDEIHILQKAIGQYLTVNSYFSTSLSESGASMFLHESDDFQRVLFMIEVDSDLKSFKPFANITRISAFPGEEEILFQMGTVFQLQSVKHRIDDDIWLIKLNLISEDQHESQMILNKMKSDHRESEANLLLLGDIIRQMGKMNDAEKYYRLFLKQKPDDQIQVADCYHSLAIIEAEKKNIERSLQYHQDALAIKLSKLKPNDPKLASSYSNLAKVYRKQGNYSEALNNYKKALQILKAAYGANHEKIAACLTNIGSTYEYQQDDVNALKYYQQALQIAESLSPIDYHSLSIALNNMGNIYSRQEQYEEALDHYQRSLDYKSKIYRNNHPSIGRTYENLGKIHEELDSEQEAQLYFQQAADIANQNTSD